MKHMFWKLYLCFFGILVMLSGIALYHVNNTLTEYELAQPEQIVEQQLLKLQDAVKNNCLDTILTFPEIEQAAYDKKITVYEDYQKYLSSVSEFTYKVKTGTFSETGQIYQIFADGDPIALLELESVREEKKLAILKVVDWQIKSFIPLMTITTYDYTVDVPTGFKVLVNNQELTPTKVNDDTDFYQLPTLYHEPEFEIYDAYGCKAAFDITENHVTPVIHTYHLSLPKSYQLQLNDIVLSGVENKDNITYTIITAKDSLQIVDSYKHSMTYTGVEDIYANTYEVSIPNNFELFIDDNNPNNFLERQTEIQKYQYCKEYATMPMQNEYVFENSLIVPKITIYDNLGNLVDCSFTNNRIEITEQSYLSDLPVSIDMEVDVLDVAKTWSLFMTDDLSGGNNGFNTIKNYLIKDSYMYNVAYKWATGVDITFTSAHRTSDNYFTDEKVFNFVQYSDELFSCDISFVKHM